MTTSTPPTRSQTVWGVVSLAAAFIVLVLFLMCCWSAAADAQGAIAFVMLLPFFVVGLVAAILLPRRSRPAKIGRVASGVAKGLAIFIALFYVTALVPGLQFFSRGVIRGVAKSYELATGRTPYAADKNLR